MIGRNALEEDKLTIKSPNTPAFSLKASETAGGFYRLWAIYAETGLLYTEYAILLVLHGKCGHQFIQQSQRNVIWTG